MRIIRFIGDDDKQHFGDERGDGTAALLLDPQGVLGRVPAGSRRGSLRGRRAVVSDDDSNMLDLIVTTLARAGCACIACRDGLEAMNAIAQEQVDLVVSDIVMPHHDGYEIFAAARAKRSNMPVVLVTGFGYDPSHVLVRASSEGLETILYKPFSPQDLLTTIEHAIRDATIDPAEALVPTGKTMPIRRILAPLDPANIICIGRNYRANDGTATEDPLEDLEVFMKPNTSAQGPGLPIRRPDFGDIDPLVDCEGELAVVIGKRARNVSEEGALQHVLGFTAANDVTARRWQTDDGPPHWMRGKGFDTFCPLGPTIVTGADLANLDDVLVRTLVNDRVVREGSTRDLIRPVGRIVSELSRFMTLSPGTVILTGAPPLADGVAPTAGLGPGDEVVVEIDPIGRLANPIESATAATAARD